ncbi:MAG TPA: hypothetical protein VK992_04865, partial [Candidatus Caenarcaniphilales bacterium]|nr:hypothetical protein [Candidatus Caenarcaniphilales bacterium]
MSYGEGAWVGLRLEGSDDTIWGQPRPEDDARLTDVLATGSATVSLSGQDSDVEGHAQSPDVTLDVEGHVITLRLPSPTEAAALRR